MFIKKFLVPGKHAADKLDFGEWLHLCTRVCLFGNDAMVGASVIASGSGACSDDWVHSRLWPQMRVMFRWGDVDNLQALTEQQILELFTHVRQAAPGLVHKKQVRATLPRLKRDATGRIPLLEFVKLCNHWPYLYFPLARMQVGQQVIGGLSSAHAQPYRGCRCVVCTAGPSATPNHGEEVLAKDEAADAGTA